MWAVSSGTSLQLEIEDVVNMHLPTGSMMTLITTPPPLVSFYSSYEKGC